MAPVVCDGVMIQLQDSGELVHNAKELRLFSVHASVMDFKTHFADEALTNDLKVNHAINILIEV